jgi:hypothetical protein
MPYDTLVWGEEQAANGLTGTAALGPGDYTTSGDTIKVKSGLGLPFLFAAGMCGDTKPQGGGVQPEFSHSNQVLHVPGAIDFAGQGWADFRVAPAHGIELQQGETLTGSTSSTNVNEGSVLGANIAYGNVPSMPGHKRYSAIDIPKCTVTSAAAVTYNSGSVTLDSAAAQTYWLDKNARYELLGITGNISGATFGGVLHVTSLAGAWHGFYPGIPANALSAVTFTQAQPFTAFAEPIPFDGDALPSVGMTASSAGAINFGMVIGRL